MNQPENSEPTPEAPQNPQPNPSLPPRGQPRRPARPHPVAVRLLAVRLHLDEGYRQAEVARQLGVQKNSVSNWVQRYRLHGEAGLQDHLPGPPAGVLKLPAAVREQVLALKRQQPHFGVKKIAQWLRRAACLPISAESVRRLLHREQLLTPPRRKPKRNPPKPRFFERATPNQMWQSDIFTFRLHGKNAYLIGFMDDHSRYLVGLDVFRSQTAEHVLEVYRTAVGEFGPPKELLTDNGRQYTSWRGTTRFEAELRKDRVAHFKSQPHHPQTLGKIERFWKTIWEDFLERAQFDSLEQARERIRLWVKHYNHRRPHQSLDGLCPADRFFAIAKELRATLEAGMAENLLELALHGQPQETFYLVGRSGNQSVVLRTEKGHLKLLIDGQEMLLTKPNPQPTGESSHDDGKQNQQGAAATHNPRTGASGVSHLDGEPPAGGSLPGTQHHADVAGPVAGTGADRDVACVDAAPAHGDGAWAAVEREAGAAADAPSPAAPNATQPLGETPEPAARKIGRAHV